MQTERKKGTATRAQEDGISQPLQRETRNLSTLLALIRKLRAFVCPPIGELEGMTKASAQVCCISKAEQPVGTPRGPERVYSDSVDLQH